MKKIKEVWEDTRPLVTLLYSAIVLFIACFTISHYLAFLLAPELYYQLVMCSVFIILYIPSITFIGFLTKIFE